MILYLRDHYNAPLGYLRLLTMIKQRQNLLAGVGVIEEVLCHPFRPFPDSI